MTAGFGGRVALTDNMIHQQDIRRALDIPRTIPAERLRIALDFSLIRPDDPRCMAGARRAARRPPTSTGRTARALDVQGTGEALLMAMAGRSDALKDLTGPGKDKLAQRM